MPMLVAPLHMEAFQEEGALLEVALLLLVVRIPLVMAWLLLEAWWEMGV